MNWINTGIIVSPFDNSSQHPAQNFGGIGSVLGHELTQGFDSNGRTYDEIGNLRDCWTEETSEAFDTRAQCLSSQYSTLSVTGEDSSILGNVDGNPPPAENITDNGGLRLAFRAYKTYMEDSSLGGVPEGTELSEDEGEKVFFLAFAQICFVGKNAVLQQALADVHTHGQPRVRGALVNNDDFARVFQCPACSAMNPVDMCVVW